MRVHKIGVIRSIEGLQEAQDANLRVIAALKPEGAMGEALRWVLTDAHRYLVTITHVDTGAYRASHRMEMQETLGSIFVDPEARNPRTQKLVREYAVVEEKRGGSHAAYGRTARDIGPRLVREGGEIVLRSLPT